MAVVPLFFATPDEWRAWLAVNHDTATEVPVGFYKVASGIPSITWPESVDQALCFGWIDGRINRIDDVSYMHRFTPRRPGSIWSAVNVRRVAELTELGLMHEAGLRAFAARSEKRTAVYAHEQTDEAILAPEYEERLRANTDAWAYFSTQPPWYQRASIRWVMDAKRTETRERRLTQLIDDSVSGRYVKPLRRSE